MYVKEADMRTQQLWFVPRTRAAGTEPPPQAPSGAASWRRELPPCRRLSSKAQSSRDSRKRGENPLKQGFGLSKKMNGLY